MKHLLIFSLSAVISISSYAGCDNTNAVSYPKQPGEISLHFDDVPVSEVVDYINSECKEYLEPIGIRNPDAIITVNFEAINCDGSAVIIKDFDSRNEKT